MGAEVILGVVAEVDKIEARSGTDPAWDNSSSTWIFLRVMESFVSQGC